MELSLFIDSLIKTGIIQVSPEILPLSREDIASAVGLLENFFRNDAMEMPGKAPDFEPGVAEWAAVYFFHAVKLTVNRQVAEEKISEYLYPFEGEISSSGIYSADLVFRHLYSLFNLARGLAPADPLVAELKRTATDWPFSSAGIEVCEIKNEDRIISNPSLLQEYLDRVISKGDKQRAGTSLIKPYIMAVTGEYVDEFFPGFKNMLSEK